MAAPPNPHRDAPPEVAFGQGVIDHNRGSHCAVGNDDAVVVGEGTNGGVAGLDVGDITFMAGFQFHIITDAHKTRDHDLHPAE